MTASAPLTIPKDRQRVRVHLGAGHSVDGVVFLEYTLREITTHNRLLLLLENGDRFFPLAREDGRTEFICKGNVRMIEVEYPDTDDVTFSLMRILPIAAHFADGARMTGELMVDAPEERSRLSDCINMPGRFLSLRSGGAIYYLNKDALRSVAPDS